MKSAEKKNEDASVLSLLDTLNIKDALLRVLALIDELKAVAETSNAEEVNYDVVGPVCETADFLGKDRSLRIKQGDLLAVCSTGAYGFTMASNYNSRPRVAEIMVDGDQIHEIRRRETVDELMNGESLLPE